MYYKYLLARGTTQIPHFFWVHILSISSSRVHSTIVSARNTAVHTSMISSKNTTVHRIKNQC